MVTYVLQEEKIDTILHFAAQTHVDNSFGNSFQFTQNNIYGTHVLLESAKKVRSGSGSRVGVTYDVALLSARDCLCMTACVVQLQPETSQHA